MKSCFAVFGALMAVLVGLMFRLSQIPTDITIRLDEKTGSTFQPLSLTPEQIETYQREGVVFIPGLLTAEESLKLRTSGEWAMNRVFQVSKLFGTKLYSAFGFDVWRTSPDLASLVLQSLPPIVAPILSYSKNEEDQVEFRLLRDSLFKYKAGGEGCGWHVDDVFFWPTEEDKDGPTVWIALDEMSIAEGGGIALVNRTLFETTSTDSNNVTLDFCRHVIRDDACGMLSLSPECYSRMEASKLQWDMKPGDAIIWNRWTFHRGVASTVQPVNPETFVKWRYSVRYTPYGSKGGPVIHPSVGEGNFFDSHYYPQVWPNLKAGEMEAISRGLEADTKLTRMPFYLGKLIWKKLIESI